MFREFRKFIQRGNVVELAVALVLGAAFNPIVRSLVDHVVMPPIGLLLGRIDFSELGIVLTHRFSDDYATTSAAMEAGEAVIAYGLFLNTVVSFAITAFAVFLLVRAYNGMQDRLEREVVEKKAEPEEPAARPRWGRGPQRRSRPRPPADARRSTGSPSDLPLRASPDGRAAPFA
jgi:large conductance mechanosensitive channel